MSTMVNLFFTDKATLRSTLTSALKGRREKMGVMPQEVDATCMLGNNIPTCEAVENNPALMTRNFFSRVSFMLGVAIDDVLDVDISDPHKRELVFQQITTHKARVAAACGPGDIKNISIEDLAPVFVVMKALEEMDTAD